MGRLPRTPQGSGCPGSEVVKARGQQSPGGTPARTRSQCAQWLGSSQTSPRFLAGVLCGTLERACGTAPRGQSVLEARGGSSPLQSAAQSLHPFLLPPRGPCSSGPQRSTRLRRQRASCLHHLLPSWAPCRQPCHPQPVFAQLTVPGSAYCLALVPVEFHPIFSSPFLQFVKIILNSNPVLQDTCSPSQLRVICKFNKHFLYSIIQVLNEKKLSKPG